MEGQEKYLATFSCTKCQGMDFKGSNPNWGAPDLAIIASYDLKDFEKLMRTAKAIGNRDLGYILKLARNQFKYLTDQEVKTIYHFFQDRIDK